jgi:hypothetical protein
MVGCNVGGLSPLRGPLATAAANRKYTDIAARAARVLLEAVVSTGAAIALWYLPLHARGLQEVIEGEQLAPINDLM